MKTSFSPQLSQVSDENQDEGMIHEFSRNHAKDFCCLFRVGSWIVFWLPLFCNPLNWR